MDSKRIKKIKYAESQLKEALKLYRNHSEEHSLQFLTVAKAFEVLFEYVWKELKFKAEDEGLFAPSPKEAIRQAASLSFISKADRWIACANARNDSVHDYFGIPEADYIKLVEEFISLLPWK